MVRLAVLHGSRAGTVHVATCFPCTIGRASVDALQLVDPGVWDGHLQLDFQIATGFRLSRPGQGRASVNGAEFDEIILRNGDVIELGGAKLQFWLADVEQSDNRARELLVWLGLGALVLLEGALLGGLL